MGIVVNYTKDGQAYPDHEVEGIVRSLAMDAAWLATTTRIHTSTANIVQVTRALIAEGVLQTEQVEFLFEGQPVVVNRFGACTDWPKGWCDQDVRLAERTMVAAMKRKRAERAEAVRE